MIAWLQLLQNKIGMRILEYWIRFLYLCSRFYFSLL